MFDLKFSTEEGRTKIKHYIYNGNMKYKEVKNEILSYGEDKLIEFSEEAIKEAFGYESYINNERIILCFNYTYYESMSGKDTIFQISRNRNKENISKIEFWTY